MRIVVFSWEKGSVVFEYEGLPDSNDTLYEQTIFGEEMHTVITLQLVLWLLI